MTRPAAATRFAVEVFVKQHEIAPVRIIRVLGNVAVTRARAVLVRQKDVSQPTRKLTGHLLERGHVSGPSRALDLERFTIEQMITFERFDDQKVDREPNGTAPVRVAAEEITVSFARNIIDPKLFVARAKDVRLLAMHARYRTKSVGREKFVFVQHVA